ncbi:MAG: SDR family NAD(P)-dependent oxidoreductase [Acidocella sp.]|nr:SDR family NAD(P)-dependent oxidoreductase [Acidocella sp.]
MPAYLITGGARGIGAGIARKLAQDGGTVVIADKQKVNLPGIRSVICDVSDKAHPHPARAGHSGRLRAAQERGRKSRRGVTRPPP